MNYDKTRQQVIKDLEQTQATEYDDRRWNNAVEDETERRMKEQIEKEFNDTECSKCNVHFSFCQSSGTYEKCYNKFLISKLISARQEIEKYKKIFDTIEIWFHKCPNILDFDRGYTEALYDVIKLFNRSK